LEIVTEEPLRILSQFIIPMFLVATSGIIPALISKHSKRQDKNQHIRFLRTNYSKIESYFYSIETYREFRIATVPLYFILGFIAGLTFELVLIKLLGKILNYVLKIDYIEKTLSFIYNITNLNAALFICSYFNISILIIFLLWVCWCCLLKSKKLAAPKITEHHSIKTSPDFPSLKMSSKLVYLSYWAFLGIIIGINLVLYANTLGYLIKYSIITDDFSFNWITFVGIYESLKTSVPYLKYYMIVFFCGVYISFLYILVVYQSITLFSNRVKKMIANFYKHDFPEVKIITEYGEIKGKLRDIQNKSQVTLIENGIMKTVQWNKIEIMEVGKKN
jgi:hypothetical protein